MDILGFKALDSALGAKDDAVDVKKGAAIFKEYYDSAASYHEKIIANERWYKLRHWEYLRARETRQSEIAPTSAWLFNVLLNKHADLMDNFPKANVLPREQGDEQTAKQLSSILPVALDRNGFEDVYDREGMTKLKIGCGVYGVFWDSTKDNGLGDISVKHLDILNLAWEPGVTDVQDGKNFFIAWQEDWEVLKELYPDKLNGVKKSSTLSLVEYIHDEDMGLQKSKKCVGIDWYYKKRIGSRTVVHFCKFVGDVKLFSSEEYSEADGSNPYADKGWYDHGLYPVVFDSLYPEVDMPTGIGYIDVCKDPQLYIDKLDQIIQMNALRVGKPRYFVNRSGNISEEEFANLDNTFIHYNGQLDDKNFREVNVSPIPAFIVNQREMKINEMKETSGNRDFNQGGTGSGVTAASAIAALQEAGNKLSRDMIKGSYRSFKRVCFMVTELFRQFYDLPRFFRIVGDSGRAEYLTFSNSAMQAKSITAYPRQEQPFIGVPVYDFDIVPQRNNPFSTAVENDRAMQLYSAGFFAPGNASQSLACLEMMSFDGIDKVKSIISQNGTLYDQLQQAMTLLSSIMGTAQGDESAGNTTSTDSSPVKSKAGQTQDEAVENSKMAQGGGVI